MLSYRHSFHAGNHADVLKHIVLLQLLDYLATKEKPYWYIDTHAGAGMYALDNTAANAQQEYTEGVGRLWQATGLPDAAAAYVGMVRNLNRGTRLRRYPGSPHIAAARSRNQDSLWLYELHPSDHSALTRSFANASQRIKICSEDGFAALRAQLPPEPRRALILLDPSYEQRQDYARVVESVKDALGRFATGTYMVWYPMIARAESRALPARLKSLATKTWLHATLKIRRPSADGFGLFGSGVFVLNPPYTLATVMRETLPSLVKYLGQDADASFHLEVDSK